ncbi:MAG TPA: ABC transporter ATP-binding protein [Acidimicrobiales bacterium]|nr:ABC transporter ATP-binding protein [Acidimicrobiales bacterium]
MNAPTVGPTVAAEHVSKWFGDVVALSDVSFEIRPGVTALLGPNGAGKSTLLRILCGLATPSRGSLRVLGSSPRDPKLYRRIGLVPQQEGLLEHLTGLAFVELAAALHGVPSPREAATRAVTKVDLDPADGRGLKAYSKGMRQRIKVAQAIVHEPEMVVLDEPLEGLDPRQRLRMIELFRELGDEGRTVLVSSHVLDEVEKFGSRVMVLAQGRMAAEGDFHSIRELMDDRPHKIRVRSDNPRAVAAALVSDGSVLGVQLGGDDSVIVDTEDAPAFRTAVARVARDEGARLLEVAPLDDDLESVFRYLVGRR